MSKKRVIVIGGGIAGMESSTNLAAMGHEVTLLEKSNELGGHLLGMGKTVSYHASWQRRG